MCTTCISETHPKIKPLVLFLFADLLLSITQWLFFTYENINFPTPINHRDHPVSHTKHIGFVSDPSRRRNVCNFSSSLGISVYMAPHLWKWILLQEFILKVVSERKEIRWRQKENEVHEATGEKNRLKSNVFIWSREK